MVAHYEDNNSNAVYALNRYLWRVLEANLDWDESQYDGGKAIVPTAQVPELMMTNKPFIVYGSSFGPVGHLYALRNESIAYNIYSTSSTEANRVASLFTDAFEGQDESAERVNNYLELEAPTREEPRGITFGSIRYTLVEKAEPADEEGGYVASLVLVEATYTVDHNTPAILDFDTV